MIYIFQDAPLSDSALDSTLATAQLITQRHIACQTMSDSTTNTSIPVTKGRCTTSTAISPCCMPPSLSPFEKAPSRRRLRYSSSKASSPGKQPEHVLNKYSAGPNVLDISCDGGRAASPPLQPDQPQAISCSNNDIPDIGLSLALAAEHDYNERIQKLTVHACKPEFRQRLHETANAAKQNVLRHFAHGLETKE